MIPILKPEFVEFIPEQIEDGTLYISETYATAVHKCCCGCGIKVVTPLSPTGWRMKVQGGQVSLYPSIGNWGFPCQSHYWIKRNAIEWSYQMSKSEIDAGRRQDVRIKEQYFDARAHKAAEQSSSDQKPTGVSKQKKGLFAQLTDWFFGTT